MLSAAVLGEPTHGVAWSNRPQAGSVESAAASFRVDEQSSLKMNTHTRDREVIRES
jgi:hypothetical protein